MVATEFLRSVGLKVSTAENGLVAVEAMKNTSFDIVLMDIQMPEMDGYQAAREMRKLGVKTPILAMTAHALSGEKEKCVAAGMNDYLTKPIKRDILFSKIAYLLSA
jgi:CheY-like chemotaxis protein